MLAADLIAVILMGTGLLIITIEETKQTKENKKEIRKLKKEIKKERK